MAYTYINGTPWEQQFTFNSSAPSDITSWNSGSALPSSALNTADLYNKQVIFIKNKVYVLGYFDSSVGEYRLYVADVDSAGVVGSFSLTSIVPPSHCGTVFTTGNKVYIVGGNPLIGGGGYTTKVYSATVDETTGELGSFSDTGNDYPMAIAGGAVAVTTDRVYIIGGGRVNFPSTNYPNVYTATISKGGILGTWTAATNLSIYSYQPSLIIGGNQTARKISALAGRRDSYPAADSIISCNSGGELTGSWSTPSYELREQLPYGQSIIGAGVVVCSNRAFLFGGYDGVGATATSTIYTAPLDSSGNVSAAWATLSTSLPHAKSSVAAFLTSSRLYLIGGAANATDARTTLYTSFLGGSNDYLSQIRSGLPDVECWLLGA